MRLNRLVHIIIMAALALAASGCTKVKSVKQDSLSLSGSRPSLTAVAVAPPDEGTPEPPVAATTLSSPLALAEVEQSAASSEEIPVVPAEILSPTDTPMPTPTPEPKYRVHVVGWGDTLLSIAIAYSASVEDIMIANGLTDNIIYLGQTLKIRTTPVPAGANTYTVQAGDTLVGIALLYGVDVDTLMAANNLTNGYFLQVGQVLVIPAGSAPQVAQSDAGTGVQAAGVQEQRVHTVAPGDTLWTIAAVYGVDAYDLALANSLGNPNVLQVGQKLIIP